MQEVPRTGHAEVRSHLRGCAECLAFAASLLGQKGSRKAKSEGGRKGAKKRWAGHQPRR